MGKRRALGTALTALLIAPPAPTLAVTTEIAYWDMNEPPGATQMLDVSGHGLDGRIGPEVGTGVTNGMDVGYRFTRLQPDTPPTHPDHLVVVPDHPALNPGDRDFSVTLRLRTTNHFGNIIQKGQATVAGGNFKLQIPNGRVECVFRGDRGTIETVAPYSINDGDWHVVTCVRVRTGVALAIDGQRVAGKKGWTGYIANHWPLSIGGKSQCDQKVVGCDYYAGDLDYVTIQVADAEF
ncbi:laminin G domain-containing protein [Actinoplanes sp. NPDC051851]|uniref:laminin G domain-containing protein n=1 Tax=Actinoplanes sp. NPDC051851 TaxID=3154753 RepID=UPI003434E3BB